MDCDDITSQQSIEYCSEEGSDSNYLASDSEVEDRITESELILLELISLLILGWPSISATMASSSRSCTSATPIVMISKKKRCHCGAFAHLLTSHTKRNPGRKFWKCANWNKHDAQKCLYFRWEDETSEEEGEDEEVKTPMPNVSYVCQGCELSKTKVNKLQKKLTNERMKVRFLIAGCVSCIMGSYL